MGDHERWLETRSDVRGYVMTMTDAIGAGRTAFSDVTHAMLTPTQIVDGTFAQTLRSDEIARLEREQRLSGDEAADVPRRRRLRRLWRTSRTQV